LRVSERQFRGRTARGRCRAAAGLAGLGRAMRSTCLLNSEDRREVVGVVSASRPKGGWTLVGQRVGRGERTGGPGHRDAAAPSRREECCKPASGADRQAGGEESAPATKPASQLYGDAESPWLDSSSGMRNRRKPGPCTRSRVGSTANLGRHRLVPRFPSLAGRAAPGVTCNVARRPPTWIARAVRRAGADGDCWGSICRASGQGSGRASGARRCGRRLPLRLRRRKALTWRGVSRSW